MARKPRKPVEPPVGSPPPQKPPPSLPPPPLPPPGSAARLRRASKEQYVAGTPRQPQTLPAESPWQKSATAARVFLEKTRSVEEVDDLVKAGRLGLRFAEVFTYFYPYRDVITGERGLLNAPPSRVPSETRTIYSFDYEQEADVTYLETLLREVNPFDVRLDWDHHRLPAVDPLAPLSAVTTEMLHFMQRFTELRRHAARLRQVARSDPKMKTKLDTMTFPRPMFCACVLVRAKAKNREKKKNGGAEVRLPTSGELVALAKVAEHPEFATDLDSPPGTASARVKSWAETRREVLLDLVPFLEKFLVSGRETGAADAVQGGLQPTSG